MVDEPPFGVSVTFEPAVAYVPLAMMPETDTETLQLQAELDELQLADSVPGPGPPSGATKGPERAMPIWSQVTVVPPIERQLMGNMMLSCAELLIVPVYVPSALKVRLPLSFTEVMVAVSPGQAVLGICMVPVAQALTIVQVPTMVPPHGLAALQVAPLPPLVLLLQDDVATSAVNERNTAGIALRMADHGRVSPQATPEQSTFTP